MKLVVDKDLCIGCGMCEGGCPDIFRIEDDGRSSVIINEIPDELKDDALDMMDGCPTNAIKEVEEEEKEDN